MTLSDKKMKAAILGMIHFLQEQENLMKKPQNQWGRAAREEIMKNREWRQRRGKMITLGRFR
jgi:hypothetical protein